MSGVFASCAEYAGGGGLEPSFVGGGGMEELLVSCFSGIGAVKDILCSCSSSVDSDLQRNMEERMGTEGI